MKAEFFHYDVTLVEPDFSSPLTDSIISLEHLRKKQLSGTTDPQIFFQLKEIFHLLESLGSARIEGNNTTVEEYVESRITATESKSEAFQEIANMERAMSFIEGVIENNTPISKAFILELHKLTVKDLKEEGDKTPGEFRKGEVGIARSSHKPPQALHVEEYMRELIDFINSPNDPKYDLLKTAISHHRFAWIHPFSNGNGRTVRLLTYAMLIKQGFQVKNGRIINPTAVFCIDRDKYYEMLSRADKGKRKGILEWCTYVLEGLEKEISKVDNLTDHSFLEKRILLPAIAFCRERENITKLEAEILKVAARKIVIQSSDLEQCMPGKAATERSRVINKLRSGNLIIPLEEGKRKYRLNFSRNYLLRGVINALREEGFITL